MPEHTLDELKKLAGPALRHAELVDIARSETPNKAHVLALVRWPRRQADATRFLAMVVRDFGQEALESLITPIGHARPSGTEHAQGDSKMATLDSVYPENLVGVSFGGGYHRNPLSLSLVILSGQGKTTPSLLDEFCRLGLDEKTKPVLVRRVLDCMLKDAASAEAEEKFYSGQWPSALLACRTFLPKEKELYRDLLLAALVHWGGQSEWPDNFADEMLPIVRSDASLQHLIYHLVKCGCEEQDIRTAWQKMLKARVRKNFLTSCITLWWKDLVINGKNLHKQAEPVAKDLLHRELKGILVDGLLDENSSRNVFPVDNMQCLKDLMRVIDYEWLRSDTKFHESVEEYFLHCYARGAAATANAVLTLVGDKFGLWDSSRSGSLQNAEERLMRGSVSKAEDLRNYGIACALAEYLDDTEAADRLRENARAFRQRVALRFTTLA